MLPQIEPVLPKPIKDVPRGRQWMYELKLDGFRGTLYVERGRGRFLSKTKNWMRRFDDLATCSQGTEWLKIKHAAYSQKEGRADLFHPRRT